MAITRVKRSYECKLYYSSNGAASASSRSGTTTSGSATITMASTTNLVAGQAVSGTGVPTGATIVSIVADTSITISANATASGSVTISFGVPWVEVAGVRTVTLNGTLEESDVTVRQGNGAKLTEPTLSDWSIDFDMPFDESDTTREAFVTAANARTALGIAVMSGNVLTTGSEGLQADMKVYTQTRDEDIAQTVNQKFTLKPCLSTTAPDYVTV